MKDSSLRLQSKTILMTGPFNSVTQSLLRTFTEFGADIALVNPHAPNASRYVEGLNEAREVHSDYGRAAFFNLPTETPDQIKEALGRLAESFGRMDILVDASPLSWSAETDSSAALANIKALAEQSLPFMFAKQKGRVIYVFEDESLQVLNLPTLTTFLRQMIQQHIHELAQSLRSKNVTVNGLSLGIGEDFILRHFAQMGSIRKSLDELQKQHADLKLVEATDAGMGAAYLASALSASLTGQTLRLTRGFHL